MSDLTPAADETWRPTAAEKLAALDTYLKILEPIARALREQVTREMGKNHDERKGAYLPDGTKIASVTRSDGALSAKLTDPAAALAWCIKNHPEEIQTVQTIRPAYLKMLLDLAKADNPKPGGVGMDPITSEELPFIEVQQGSAYVTITTTREGVERMERVALDFADMLEART